MFVCKLTYHVIQVNVPTTWLVVTSRLTQTFLIADITIYSRAPTPSDFHCYLLHILVSLQPALLVNTAEVHN